MDKYLGRFGVAAMLAVAACAGAVAVGRAEPPAAVPAAAAPSDPAPSDPAPRPAASPEDLARGKALFIGACAAYCHRPSQPEGAVAGADAPYLFGCEWRHGGSDAQIFQTISKGVPNTRMVAFGGAIPDEDVWRIVAYLRSATQCKPTL